MIDIKDIKPGDSVLLEEFVDCKLYKDMESMLGKTWVVENCTESFIIIKGPETGNDWRWKPNQIKEHYSSLQRAINKELNL